MEKHPEQVQKEEQSQVKIEVVLKTMKDQIASLSEQIAFSQGRIAQLEEELKEESNVTSISEAH